MVNVFARVRALVRDDRGQDLIEYALLAGLISLIAVVAMTGAGTQVNRVWEGIEAALTGVPDPPPAAP